MQKKDPSPREFGTVFTIVFAILGFYPLLHGQKIRWALIPIAVLLFLLTILAPGLLRPLAKLWQKFGTLMHKIVSPVVMALMYFAIFSPFALLLRMAGKKFLKLNWEKSAATYWEIRNPPGPTSDSIREQF